MKNTAMAGKDVVSMPYSSLKAAIAAKLQERGVVASVLTRGKKAGKTLELTLTRNEQGVYRFSDVKRVSKPGCRVYFGFSDVRPVRGGAGAVVISTPKGILFGEEARKEKVGGEALFEIW